ncbi:winged helix-turn-helix domain-containing protein [Halosimplex rubrum]|uniref:Winged helix-turn-helix domain-containing protein n=1 Tax=Halosimplex rubrum TaxID=869889 RepID=A0A7D5T098_9EURY|nr:winged helix-turn-helix domain-containing protein [Halosimplex rubrum]QLH77848.1 winged helix-turn-helix domain-containing protein [Halosimplex rubrum]
MSRADRGADQPRAMIHRRILDVAESNPDASMTAIAEEVSGASPDLVDRVLDEYGDPGRDPEPDDETSMNAPNASAPETDPETEQDESATEPNDPSAETDDSAAEPAVQTPTAAELSEKQRRTLRALYERPGASQGDLAEDLDVTRATVSRRLNAIPGFEWTDRRAFAESVFDEATDGESDEAAGGESDDADDEVAAGDPTTDGGQHDGRESVDPKAVAALEGALTDLAARLDAVESRVGESDDADGSGDAGRSDDVDDAVEADAAPALSPELAHKVVHACMESDRVTEDEELDVLRAFMES